MEQASKGLISHAHAVFFVQLKQMVSHFVARATRAKKAIPKSRVAW
jgi:hypothetical protein